jgi:hypothetical protein
LRAAFFEPEMDPTLQNKIRHMVEVEGMTPDELLKKLHEDAEQSLIDAADEAERKRRSLAGLPSEIESIPQEVRLIAQALAYRVPTLVDIDEIHRVLQQSYQEEVEGEEAFRIGDTVSKATIESLLSDNSYKWIVVETPNGYGIERDGAILGVCCFSTDGVSRRSGEYF